MTSRESVKRPSPALEDGSQSDSASASTRGDEKTIPFLRRLTDMLIENEEFISFTPGSRENGQVVLGKIVVHDRVKVESIILPRYFNHSSFASLRRQLNYFSFTRIGKGRQRGATYCNEGVVELNDILSLTRRSVGNNSSSDAAAKAKVRRPSLTREQVRSEVPVPPRNIPNKRLRTMLTTASDSITSQTPIVMAHRVLPARVSPVEGLIHPKRLAPKRISLDLTSFSSEDAFRPRISVTIMPTSSTIAPESVPTPPMKSAALVPGDDGDKDLLDGCRALLCFSRGIPSR